MPLLGKASLKESFLLAAPASPSRPRFPKEAELLKVHGFDSDFDKRLARLADAILAEETPLHERLEPALEQQRARRTLCSLPCLSLRLSKPLTDEAKAAELPPAPGRPPAPAAVLAELAEARQRCAELLASLLLDCGVEGPDVLPCVEAGKLQFQVPLRAAFASVHRVEEILSHACHDKKQFSELHETFTAAGCSDAPALLAIDWPLERVQEEVRLAFPEYELPLEELAKELPELVRACWKTCQEAWERAGGDEPGELAPLAELESLGRFGGGALALPEAARRGLRRDAAEQGAQDLAQLLDDAAAAQRALKELLAEGSAWSQCVFPSAESPPEPSESRAWHSSPSDLAPSAVHFDPGVQDRHAAFEASKRAQRRYEAQPAFSEVLDAARLAVTFASPADAAAGVRRLLERLDVVWLQNEFRHPSCLGCRSMTLGVRQLLTAHGELQPSGQPQIVRRAHIAELKVHLQHTQEAQEACERLCAQALRQLLARCGVLPQHVDRATGIVLRALGATEGRCREEAETELERIVRYYTKNFVQLGVEGQLLAEELADELADQALAARLPQARVAELLAPVPELNARRGLRDRRVALVNEVAHRLSSYVGVVFEELLLALLGDLPALPRDDRGRLSLGGRWWEQVHQLAGADARWRAVAPGAVPQLQQECGDWSHRNAALCAEELELLGRSKDLSLQLEDLCARSAADQLTQTLLGFLLARGAGASPSCEALARAAAWARDASGASEEVLFLMSEFLVWARCEDQLCAALQPGPSGPNVRVLADFAEALVSGDSAGTAERCAIGWQFAGLRHVCQLLKGRSAAALPLAVVMLARGAPEVRSQLAEAAAATEAEDDTWPLQLVAASAAPALAAMLAGGRGEARPIAAALLALRSLAARAATCAAVSEAGVIPRCAELALSTAHGQEVSFFALGVLNNLAKASEENAEAIREQGLKVDSVGRVKKK